MKRPHLVHLLSIIGEEYISLKAAVTMREITGSDRPAEGPRFPIQAFRLLNAYRFKLLIVGLNESRQEIYSKVFESDSFGNFFFKIPLNATTQDIEALQIYETAKFPGLEILLGTFIPLKLKGDIKIVICDFDKTLVDTKYSTTKEVYRSLTRPLEDFPTVEKSVALIKEAIRNEHHPFILSASPHFYEDAMRDWLYQHNIFSAGIFLKDYREVFALFDGGLAPKDLKIHGLYKLNHLLDILLMTGIPNELILMGDNFESDPIIYATLAKLINDQVEPRNIWKQLRELEIFQLSRKQRSQLLNKMYQINNIVDRKKERLSFWPPSIKIFIRKKGQETSLKLPHFFQEESALIELYEGKASRPKETIQKLTSL